MKKVLYTGTILLSLGALWVSGIDDGYADSFNDELIVAVERNQAANVYKIIRNGASVNKRGKYQNTALIKAAAAGYSEIGKILIENGADVNLQNLSGASAIHRAAGNGNIDFIQLLLDKKANINIKDGEGWTPLMAAVARKRADVAKLLITNGADIDVASFFGENALHLAVKVRSEDMVNLLLEAGSDPMSKNSKGQTAYEIADEKSLALATIITSHTNKKSLNVVDSGEEGKNDPKTYNEFIDEIDNSEQSQIAALQDAEDAFKEAAAEIKAAKIMADIKNVEAQLKIEKAKEELSKIRLRREIAEQAMLSRKAAKEKKIRLENIARIEAEKELERIARENRIKEARRLISEEDARIQKISGTQPQEEIKIAEAVKPNEPTEALEDSADNMSENNSGTEIADNSTESGSELEEKIEAARQEERSRISNENAELRQRIEQEVRQVLNAEFSKKVVEFEERQKEAKSSLAKMKESINEKIEKANEMVARKNDEIEKLKQYASILEAKQVSLINKIQTFLKSDSSDSNNDGAKESPANEKPSGAEIEQLDSPEKNIDISKNTQDADTTDSNNSSNTLDSIAIPEADKENSEDLTIKDLDRISQIEKDIMALEASRQQKMLETNILASNSKAGSASKNIQLTENTKRKRRVPMGNRKNIKKVTEKKELKEIFVPKISDDKVISKNWWESSKEAQSDAAPIEKTNTPVTEETVKESIDVVAPDMQTNDMSNDEIDQSREGAIERLKQAKEEIISDVTEKEISDEELDALTEINTEDNVFENEAIGEAPVDATKIAPNENSMESNDIIPEVANEVPVKNTEPTEANDSIDSNEPAEIEEIQEKMNQVENKSTAKFNRIAALKRLRAARDKISKSAQKNNTRKISSRKLFNDEIIEIASADKAISQADKRKNVISEARKRAYDIINENKAKKTATVIKSNKDHTADSGKTTKKRTAFLANLEKELSKPSKKSKSIARTNMSAGGNEVSKLPWKESAEKDSKSIDDASIKITKIRPIDGSYPIKNSADKNRRNIEKIAKIIASIENSSKTATTNNKLNANNLANSGNITKQANDAKNKKANPSFVSTNGEYKVSFTGKPSGVKSGNSSAYWLKIGNFVDSRTAYQHYRNVTSEYIIKGLQYRPIYSAKPGMNNVSFKVGPLKSINEASKLCMKFRGDNLGCSTVATAK